MSRRLNLERLRGAVAVLKTIATEDQLYSLKKLARNNGGTWNLPSECLNAEGTPVYQPSAISIDVFQVRATAHAVEDLAHAWIVEAERLLEAADARVGEMA